MKIYRLNYLTGIIMMTTSYINLLASNYPAALSSLIAAIFAFAYGYSQGQIQK